MTTKLGNYIKILQGFAFKTENYVEKSDYRLVTLGNFQDGGNCFKYNDDKATYYGADFPSKVILQEGDLILPLTEQVIGLFGNSAFIPHEERFKFVLNQRVGKIVLLNDDIDKYYLHYLLATKQVKKQLEARASGTKQRNISPDDVYDVSVELPDIDTQRIIGNLFYKVERKQELNNKINSELESMAKTLYDYWFLQFEFPNEDGKPYKSSGGKMVYNEQLKKEIPEGWEVVELGSQIFENNKSTIQVNDVENIGKIPFFTSGEEILNCSEKMVSGLNIYMSTGGNASIKLYFGDAAYSTDTWCINAGTNTLFYYEYLMTIKQQINDNYFDGSGLKHLKKDAFKKILLYIPKIDVVEKFNQIVEKYIQLISQKTLENKDLSELRDFLLPLLMNGQVTVGD